MFIGTFIFLHMSAARDLVGRGEGSWIKNKCDMGAMCTGGLPEARRNLGIVLWAAASMEFSGSAAPTSFLFPMKWSRKRCRKLEICWRLSNTSSQLPNLIFLIVIKFIFVLCTIILRAISIIRYTRSKNKDQPLTSTVLAFKASSSSIHTHGLKVHYSLFWNML